MGKLYRLADKQSILYNRLGLQLGLSLAGLKLGTKIREAVSY